MAEAFNLNQFLNEYKTYHKQYTAVESGQEAMEKRDIARAEEAVSGNFLGLTLSEKISEMGVGPRVIEQLGDTAKNIVADVVSPLRKWLEENENVFDGRIYDDIQTDAKQMFYTKVALDAEVKHEVLGKLFTMLS